MDSMARMGNTIEMGETDETGGISDKDNKAEDDPDYMA